jgi:AcrR family transcriptional regulator
MASDPEERERILQLTKEEFFQRGFHRVTVDELAAKLGMSKKTIYKYFPTKEDLVRNVVYFIRDQIGREAEAVLLADKPFAPKTVAMLTIVGRIWGTMGRQFPEDMKRYAPDLWAEIQQFRRDRILTKLAGLFRDAKRQGVFREEVNEEIFLLVFQEAIEGIMNPYVLSEQSFSANDAFRQILHILFEGVLTDASRKELKAMERTAQQRA